MVEQYLVTSQIIFSCMVGACTAAKGRQSRFIRGYSICGLSSNHKNHEYSPPGNYQLYGTSVSRSFRA